MQRPVNSVADENEVLALFALSGGGVSRQFVACLLAGFLLIIPIILFVHRYIDDYGRSMDGSYHWTQVGRPLADGLVGLVNLGAPSVAVAPLHQLLALTILSFAAVIGARAYGLRSAVWTPLATLPIIGQPYGLENLSYGFDSLFMATALTLAVAAAVLLHRLPTWRCVWLAAAMLLACLCLYQPAAGAFLAFGLMLVVAEILGLSAAVTTAQGAGCRITRVMAAYGLSLAAYALLTQLVLQERTSYASEQGQLLSMDGDLPWKLVGHALGVWTVIFDDWHRWPVVAPWLLLVLAYALVVWIYVGRLPVGQRGSIPRLGRWVLVLGAVGLVALISPGALLGLADPMARVPRLMLFLGPLLSALALQIVVAVTQARRRGYRASLVMTLPLLGVAAFAWLLVIFSYAYGHAYAAQAIYEQGRISRLIDGISRLRVQLPGDTLTTISIDGEMPMSPVLNNSQTKFPLLARLVPRLVNHDWAWGPKQLQFHGLQLNRKPLEPGASAQGPCVPSTTTACTAEYSLKVQGQNLLVRML
jgi:hypothetical protein